MLRWLQSLLQEGHYFIFGLCKFVSDFKLSCENIHKLIDKIVFDVEQIAIIIN